jgi:Flp pilus assembly pilin Flp
MRGRPVARKRITEVDSMSERISLLIGRIMLPELREEKGQGAVEYALAVLAVAAIIAAAMGGFTKEIENFMKAAGTKLATYIPA